VDDHDRPRLRRPAGRGSGQEEPAARAHRRAVPGLHPHRRRVPEQQVQRRRPQGVHHRHSGHYHPADRGGELPVRHQEQDHLQGSPEAS